MQKIHTNSREFVRISYLNIMHEIREKFVHEFMPEEYVSKEKIWGKYQYHQDKIRGKIAYVKMSKKHMSPTGL